MDQNSLIAIGIFSIICVICIATIGLSLVKENKELRNRLSEKSKSKNEVCLSSLSNNLPLLRHDCKFSQNGAVEYARKIENENERLKKIIENEEIKVTSYGNTTNLKANRLEKEVLYQKGRAEYFEKRLYKEINKESEKQFKVVMTVTKEDDNILDAVDKILSEANKQDVTINTNRNVK